MDQSIVLLVIVFVIVIMMNSFVVKNRFEMFFGDVKESFVERIPLYDVVHDKVLEGFRVDNTERNDLSVIEDILMFIPLAIFIGVNRDPLYFKKLLMIYIFCYAVRAVTYILTPLPPLMKEEESMCEKYSMSDHTDIGISGHTIFALTPLVVMIMQYKTLNFPVALAGASYLCHEFLKLILKHHYSIDIFLAIVLVCSSAGNVNGFQDFF